jgi:hypothetical protein
MVGASFEEPQSSAMTTHVKLLPSEFAPAPVGLDALLAALGYRVPGKGDPVLMSRWAAQKDPHFRDTLREVAGSWLQFTSSMETKPAQEKIKELEPRQKNNYLRAAKRFLGGEGPPLPLLFAKRDEKLRVRANGHQKNRVIQAISPILNILATGYVDRATQSCLTMNEKGGLVVSLTTTLSIRLFYGFAKDRLQLYDMVKPYLPVRPGDNWVAMVGGDDVLLYYVDNTGTRRCLTLDISQYDASQGITTHEDMRHGYAKAGASNQVLKVHKQTFEPQMFRLPFSAKQRRRLYLELLAMMRSGSKFTSIDNTVKTGGFLVHTLRVRLRGGGSTLSREALVEAFATNPWFGVTVEPESKYPKFLGENVIDIGHRMLSTPSPLLLRKVFIISRENIRKYGLGCVLRAWGMQFRTTIGIDPVIGPIAQHCLTFGTDHGAERYLNANRTWKMVHFPMTSNENLTLVERQSLKTHVVDMWNRMRILEEERQSYVREVTQALDAAVHGAEVSEEAFVVVPNLNVKLQRFLDGEG